MPVYLVARAVAVELLYNPLWWFTGGLIREWERCQRRIYFGNDYFGVMLWARNLLVPMYGQRDTGGRVISLIARLLQLSVRLLCYGFWCLWAVFIFIFYLVAPIVVVWQLFMSLQSVLR